MPEPFSGLVGPTLGSSHVELSESVYRTGFEQPRHTHEPAYLTAVLAGGYEETTDRCRRTVGAGALLFHPAGETHAVRFTGSSTRVFRVRLLPPMVEAVRLARARVGAAVERGEAARAIVGRMRAAYSRPDPLAPLTLDSLACELVAVCANGRPNRRAWDPTGARCVRDLIEAHLEEVPSLDELAIVAGCHRITLARAFRRTFGCSVGGYIRRRRLEEAARMLLHTDLGISEVAVRCGFADQAHLTRGLRAASGRTPGALRAFKTACSALRRLGV